MHYLGISSEITTAEVTKISSGPSYQQEITDFVDLNGLTNLFSSALCNAGVGSEFVGIITNML